jgi:hypothetical protein
VNDTSVTWGICFVWDSGGGAKVKLEGEKRVNMYFEYMYKNKIMKPVKIV